ncbi:hypothetical protein JW823_03610 [bacterium]|nr:hypothetical protein [candidate division CSSED10-310 bacterium]
MRLVEVLQLTAAILAVPAGMFSSIEKKILGHFRQSEATSPDTAIELPPLKKFARWRVSRLKSLGAIISTESDMVYFSKTVYSSIRKRRALIAVSFVIVTFTCVVLLYKLF